MSIEDSKKIKQLAEMVSDQISLIDPYFFESRGYGDAKTFKMTVVLCLLDAQEVVPIDLDKLLSAGDANIMHDVMGVFRHWNPVTKKMEDCFHPRCAVSQ